MAERTLNVDIAPNVDVTFVDESGGYYYASTLFDGMTLWPWEEPS